MASFSDQPRYDAALEDTKEDDDDDKTDNKSKDIPMRVRLEGFTKHRIQEVLLLSETIKEKPFKGQVFQRLPKHIRRRQMSHHIKRLPRRLQTAHLLSLKDGPPPTTKRPSRKYRRRPNNLLQEYNRRQQENIWLETHIWHAKRFHMVKRWGYKLPEKAINKGFRANYRATSQHCLLLDMSYYNVIELRGKEDVILKGLQQCVSTSCGLTFQAKMYMNGMREGSVMLYHPNSYPYKAIGNVTFLWKPTNDEFRVIWIWVHPSMHEEVAECFKVMFDLVEENSIEIMEVEDEKFETRKKGKKNVEKVKLEPKNIPFVRTPKYKNSDSSLTMILLKDTLNRFSLTGPLSQAVISQAFDIAEPDMKLSCKRKFSEIDADENLIKKSYWWDEYYKESEKIWLEQKKFYELMKNLSTPNEIPSHVVLSIVVSDPRLNIPEKRTKCVPYEKGNVEQISTDMIIPALCKSPLWESGIRDEVSLTKPTVAEINEARSKLIVPGGQLGEMINEKRQPKVPLILIQKPGNKNSEDRLGFGSGWEIIVPANWAMPVWLSLIFRGARSGGRKDYDSFLLESHNLKNSFQPDSKSARVENLNRCEELRRKYFRLPPSKRPNYNKLSTPSPFYCPWSVLMKDWIADKSSESEIKFYVLRDRKKLEILSGVRKNLRETFKPEEMNCLVPVSVECVDKGRPREFSMLCLPTNDDYANYKTSGLLPVEPLRPDRNEQERKERKKEHLKRVKSSRRARKKEKLKLREKINNQPGGEKLNLKPKPLKNDINSEYHKKMESLWLPLPENLQTVRNVPSREIFGFLVKGDFSLSKAKGFGLGYVTLPGLLNLLRDSQKRKTEPYILIRNPDHTKYRFGNVKVLIN